MDKSNPTIDFSEAMITGSGDTAAASALVRNPSVHHGEVREFLKRYYRNYRQNKWKKEIRDLAVSRRKSVREICRYIGIPESDAPRFWMRTPKQREYYIGIGMCLKQPLEVINRWLRQYCGSRQLYIKDAKSDLVWIYLIDASLKADDSRNFFAMYGEISDQVDLAFARICNDNDGSLIDTDALYDEYRYLSYDEDSLELLRFVETHFENFKTAYAKPRKMLRDYLNTILAGLNATGSRKWTLNRLRGYLDDNTINYLSGNYMCIYTTNHSDGMLTSRMKRVPRTKRAHIALGASLGMMLADLDTYLVSMGYDPLDPTDPQEGRLINLLVRWELQHPEQAALLEGRLTNPAAMRAAAENMLDMRGYLTEQLNTHRE